MAHRVVVAFATLVVRQHNVAPHVTYGGSRKWLPAKNQGLTDDPTTDDVPTTDRRSMIGRQTDNPNLRSCKGYQLVVLLQIIFCANRLKLVAKKNYKLNCLFLKHHNEANKKRNHVGFSTALVHCTNYTKRLLCRFIHASCMSLMSLVNDKELFVPNGISG